MTTYAYLSIGFGGWTMHSADGLSKLSHYGDTWREHVYEMTDDVIGVDLTACQDPDFPGQPSLALIELTLMGPMPRGSVEPGTFDGFAGCRPLDPSKPYGGAGSLSYVNPRDYARMAAAIGARVFDPRAIDVPA